VSSTRGAPAKSRRERSGIPVAPRAVRTSKNLFSFVVAKTRRLPSNRWELLHEPFIDNSFENFLLLLNQILDALVGETKHFLELSLAERAFFRGPLNFDEPAASCANNIHVDIGPRILKEIEIEARLLLDDPNADRRHIIIHRKMVQNFRFDHTGK